LKTLGRMHAILRENRKQSLLGALLCLLGHGVTGCAVFPQGSTNPITLECILPEDQTETLSGRWKTLPIPLAIEAESGGGFPQSEAEIIIAAADRWNNHFEAVIGQKVFDYGEKDAVRTFTATKPSSVCSEGIVSGTKFTGNVEIYLHSTWPYTNLKNVIALTTFCPTTATPFNNIYMAIMEANYQDFFVAGKKIPDLESIFVHEFGHLLGVGHSCSTKDEDGFPDCSGTEVDPSYLSAVLFPSFGFNEFGAGEVRSTLNENDQGRANCLYEDFKASGSDE
jgi:hypothetical protein